jgi:hypothetical protein
MLSTVRHFGNFEAYSGDHRPLNIHVRKGVHNISFVNCLETRETTVKVCSIVLYIFVLNNKYLGRLGRDANINACKFS